MKEDNLRKLRQLKLQLENIVPIETRQMFSWLKRLEKICKELPFLTDAHKKSMSRLVEKISDHDCIDERLLSLSLQELIAQLESCAGGRADHCEANVTSAICHVESAFSHAAANTPADGASLENSLSLLNEAASQLIEVHVEDDASIATVQKLIKRILDQDSLETHIMDLLEKADDQFDLLLSGANEYRIEAILEIGQFIDSALDHLEDLISGVCCFGKDSSSPAMPEPSKDVSVLDDKDKKEHETKTQDSADKTMLSDSPSHPEPAASAPPLEADEELVAAFINESRELADKAEKALLELEKKPEDMNAVNQVFRCFHTIKGTSAFLNFSPMTRLCHGAESLLSAVRSGRLSFSGQLADPALESVDMVRHLANRHGQGCDIRLPEGYDELIKKLEQLETDISEKPGESVSKSKTSEKSSADDNGLSEADSGNAVQDEQEKMTVSAEETCPFPYRPISRESSIRVGTQRLDRMIDMVGELVVSHSMVAQDKRLEREENTELFAKIQHTAKIVRELQNLSMLMRMVPLKATFQKMRRLVRDLSKKTGKRVRLVTDGESTEIDRNMVDIIDVPLVHMVRNAMDHGIEPAEERKTSGKSETGTIGLTAYHSAGNVVVEISDDGRGMDHEKILRVARDRALVSSDQVLDELAIFDLVFHPGFSTADTVSDVSGRGVGMDAVRKNIEALNGHIEIQSRKAVGSTFKIRLPLTLAIIDGMVFRVGPTRYVLPTVCIVKSLQLSAGQTRSVQGKGRVLTVFDKLVPLFDLGELFETPPSERNTGENQRMVIVIEYEGKLAGLVIEELIGRQQIVVKSLGESMRDIPGISAASIMPDGQVGLILDIGGIVRLAHGE